MKQSRTKLQIIVISIILLFVIGTILYAKVYQYFPFSTAEMTIGTIIDGKYYFSIPHKGLYCYVPTGEKECLLKPFEYSQWTAEEDGLYYENGKNWYRLNYTTKKREKAEQIELSEKQEAGNGTFDKGQILARTEEYIFYRKEATSEPSALYCYDVTKEESWLICKKIEAYTATTDGTWLFICTPWNRGNTSCWKINYDGEGTPYGIEVVRDEL